MTPDGEKVEIGSEDVLAATTGSPLVFISHDARDAALAEEFSRLLKSVSAGMIKTFRSTDKKGNGGIDFGEEWYKQLMIQLQSTSDVVCLFTERSVDRPWILFEAGVAKGKLNTPVIGVALGIPLNRISAGPFYQFQNTDDSEADLTKLINQLARRVPGLEVDPGVVKSQVAAFKEAEVTILKELGTSSSKKQPAEESAVAKLAEEMKALPSRVAERLADSEEPFRRRRNRHFHPMMFEEIAHMSGKPGDPVPILMAASMVREDVPWLYELAMEVYRAVKSGDEDTMKIEMERMRRFADFSLRSPWMQEMGGRDTPMFLMEFPRMLEGLLHRSIVQRSRSVPKKRKPSTSS
jgi:hypothetical protein